MALQCRKNARNLIRNTGISVLNQTVNTKAAEAISTGQTGTEIIKDYLNTKVLSAYAPIEVVGMHWGIIAEMSEKEVMAPLYNMRNMLLVSVGFISIILTLFSLGVSRIFSQPLYHIENTIKRFTEDDTGAVVRLKGTDEFAKLGGSLNSMMEKIRQHKDEITSKNEENKRLLRTVLPPAIADRIQRGDVAIAETFHSVTVVYATIGQFGSVMDKSTAEEMINLLNEVIDGFDEAAERHGVERINTIGDVYVAASGVPMPWLDHARRAYALATDMLKVIERFNRNHGLALTVSVGLASGDVGIVGRRRFVYEVLGQNVVIARQLSLETKANQICLADTTYQELKTPDDFSLATPVHHTEMGDIKCWAPYVEY